MKLKIEKVRYFSLRKKNEREKEIYSSPGYFSSASSEEFDKEKVVKNLKFYLERVNSGIHGQMESQKVPEEVKKGLKFLKAEDFEVVLMEMWNEGGWSCREISRFGCFKEFAGSLLSEEEVGI